MEFTDPPTGPATVTLVVPGIAAAFASSGDQATIAPQLAWLAGRGSLRRAWQRGDLTTPDLCSWQRGLLDALALDHRDYPSAPISAFGADDALTGPLLSGVPSSSTVPADETGQDGYWLHAEPVHLAAGLNRLTLLPLRGLATVTLVERAALTPLLAEHLRASSLRLRVGAAGDWFIQAQCALDVVTTTPDAAAANALEAVMPRGADAAALRRLMTEWQMLLHEHAVNTRREHNGLPAINAIWPWGGGVLHTVTPRPLPPAYADQAFVRGIYRKNGVSVQAPPASGEALLDRLDRQPVFAMVTVSDVRALEHDWLAPLVRALRSRRIRQLDLHLDEWRVQISAPRARHFWRKPLPPAAWPI